MNTTNITINAVLMTIACFIFIGCANKDTKETEKESVKKNFEELHDSVVSTGKGLYSFIEGGKTSDSIQIMNPEDSVKIEGLFPNGKIGLAYESGLKAVIFELETGKRLRELTIDGSIEESRFSLDSTKVAFYTYRGSVYVWDIKVGSAFRFTELDYVNNYPSAIAISHDGSMVLAGTQRSVSMIWDTTTGKMLRKIDTPDMKRVGSNRPKAPSVSAVAISPDKTSIALLVQKGIYLYDMSTGKMIRHFSTEKYFSSFKFSPDGNFIVAGPKLMMWNVATGKLIHTLLKDSDEYMRVHTISNDSKFLMASSTEDITFFDLVEAKKRKIYKTQKDKKHIEGILFLPEKGKFLSYKSDKVTVWKLPNWTTVLKKKLSIYQNSLARAKTISEKAKAEHALITFVESQTPTIDNIFELEMLDNNFSGEIDKKNAIIFSMTITGIKEPKATFKLGLRKESKIPIKHSGYRVTIKFTRIAEYENKGLNFPPGQNKSWVETEEKIVTFELQKGKWTNKQIVQFEDLKHHIGSGIFGLKLINLKLKKAKIEATLVNIDRISN